MIQVVAVLLRRGEKLLLCKRPAHKARGGHWELAGGKIEPGESPEQALIRECREELGIEIRPGKLAARVTHAYPDVEISLFVYEAALCSGEPQGIEHTELRWVTPAQAAALPLCPADAKVLQQIGAKQ